MDIQAQQLLDGKETFQSAFVGLFAEPIEIRRKATLVRQGDHCTNITILVQGLAIRYTTTLAGDRQILGLIFPGQIVSLEAIALGTAAHSVETMMDCEVAYSRTEHVVTMLEADPGIASEFLKRSIAETATAREWMINLGRRSAHARVAHLLCEVSQCLRDDAFYSGVGCPFPLTQQDIADITSLSIVHVNRILQDFRASGTIVLRTKVLEIADWARLSETGEFDGEYLHDVKTLSDY